MYSMAKNVFDNTIYNNHQYYLKYKQNSQRRDKVAEIETGT